MPACQDELVGVIRTSRGLIGLAERGGGEAVPIVFLHGVGSDKSVWGPQLHHFGRSRRAIAFDYPGYGESDPISGNHDDFAMAILAAMDALEIESAHICGLSLGGVVAIAMHALAAERCASLVLADTFAEHPEGVSIYQRALDASRSMGMRGLAEARVDMLLGSAATAHLRAEVIETMAAIDPHAYRAGSHTVWLADQREQAKGIDKPTLIICGDEDRITPPALSEQLAELIPGARLELIEAAGHLSNIEQPGAFNAAIDRFLADVEGNSA